MSGNQFDIRHSGVYASPMLDIDDPWVNPAPALSIPKQKPERDEDYLAFIRTLPCSKCGRPAPSCAHHHPLAGHSSTGSKTSDYRSVPLCCDCHIPGVHQYGKLTFWGNLEAVEDLIVRLNIRYFFGADVAHI